MIESSFPDSSGITSCGQDQQGQQQHHRARHGLCPALQTVSVSSFYLLFSCHWFIPSPSPNSKVCPLCVGAVLWYVAFPAEAIILVLMCNQRLHKPSPFNRTCLFFYPPKKKCGSEWQSRKKEGESTEGKNGSSVREEWKRKVMGARGGERRNSSCLCISCWELKLCAGTVCAHVSGIEEGRGRKEGGREGRVLERAVRGRPPLCPLVASCSTSGDLSVNLTELCQRTQIVSSVLLLLRFCLCVVFYRGEQKS